MRGELIARVESATGADRELDLAIVYALFPNIGPYDGQCIGDDAIFWHEPYRKRECPALTGSVDAALELVEMKLANAFFHMSRFADGGDKTCEAHIYPNRLFGDDYLGEGWTLPLAILSALLRALPEPQDPPQ